MGFIPLLVFAASLLMPSSASTTVSPATSLTSGISATKAVPLPASTSVSSSNTRVTSASVSSKSTQTPPSVSLTVSQSSKHPSSSSLSATATSTAAAPASSSLSADTISPTSASLGVSSSTLVGPVANPCGKNNGGCAHKCVRHGSGYNCTCNTGFELKSDGHNCTDINECNSTSDDNKCAHICVNTEGSYACACRTGYELKNDGLACEKDAKTSPTSKATSDGQEWDWMILGIVIGVVILAILILVAGVISKRVTRSERKENITGLSGHEMTVKTTSAMAATNPVAIED
ncbi:hypothetical protein ACROYT_G003450 [Oculina patagonica]